MASVRPAPLVVEPFRLLVLLWKEWLDLGTLVRDDADRVEERLPLAKADVARE